MEPLRRRLWLVEIRLKDWRPDLISGGRIIGYEEVLAVGKFNAQLAGAYKFAERCQYEPKTKRMLAENGLEVSDVCAPDAVEID